MLGCRTELLSCYLVTKILKAVQNLSNPEKSGSCELLSPTVLTTSQEWSPGSSNPGICRDFHLPPGDWQYFFAVGSYHNLIFKMQKSGQNEKVKVSPGRS